MMKFLCDVHIPNSLVNHLNKSGNDTVNVNELPDKWFTNDKYICEFADLHNRIVISKDSDFKNSFFIDKTPKKLIKVNLGNISNSELIRQITENLVLNEKLNHSANFMIEIGVDTMQIFST